MLPLLLLFLLVEVAFGYVGENCTGHLYNNYCGTHEDCFNHWFCPEPSNMNQCCIDSRCYPKTCRRLGCRLTGATCECALGYIENSAKQCVLKGPCNPNPCNSKCAIKCGIGFQATCVAVDGHASCQCTGGSCGGGINAPRAVPMAAAPVAVPVAPPPPPPPSDGCPTATINKCYTKTITAEYKAGITTGIGTDQCVNVQARVNCTYMEGKKCKNEFHHDCLHLWLPLVVTGQYYCPSPQCKNYLGGFGCELKQFGKCLIGVAEKNATYATKCDYGQAAIKCAVKYSCGGAQSALCNLSEHNCGQFNPGWDRLCS